MNNHSLFSTVSIALLMIIVIAGQSITLPVFQYTTPAVAKTYYIDLPDLFDMGPANQTKINAFNKFLMDRRENDAVYIKINSGGGYTDIMYDIVYHLKMTNAKTIAVVDGTAASAASTIMMECDDIIFKNIDKTKVMIHTVRVGFDEPSQSYYGLRHNEYLKIIYYRIMTDKERTLVFEDHKQLWLPAKEMKKRLCTIDKKYCDNS